jgi:hypothetical protein
MNIYNNKFILCICNTESLKAIFHTKMLSMKHTTPVLVFKARYFKVT